MLAKVDVEGSNPFSRSERVTITAGWNESSAGFFVSGATCDGQGATSEATEVAHHFAMPSRCSSGATLLYSSSISSVRCPLTLFLTPVDRPPGSGLDRCRSDVCPAG